MRGREQKVSWPIFENMSGLTELLSKTPALAFLSLHPALHFPTDSLLCVSSDHEISADAYQRRTRKRDSSRTETCSGVKRCPHIIFVFKAVFVMPLQSCVTYLRFLNSLGSSI